MTVQHHLRLGPDELAGNGGLGRYVFLPGDPGRAGRIARAFDAVERIESPRGLNAYLGRLPAAGDEPPVEVLAVPTGIGAAATEVVVHELIACGARRLLRVGSCGTMTERIRPGQVVLATAAVRDEGTTRDYAPPEYPAVAHADVLSAMTAGARAAGLAAETFRGVCHSKDSLYGREFGHGPGGEENLRYCDRLRRCGVIASEMECSTLFVLAATAAPGVEALATDGDGGACQAGAVLAVFGTDRSDMEFDPELARLAEERAIGVALAGTRVWARRDRVRGRAAAPA